MKDASGNDQRDHLLDVAFSPDSFRVLAEQWQQMLADHLQRVQSGSGPVLNWATPQELIVQAESFLDVDGPSPGEPPDLVARFRELVARILQSGQNLHHPRYLGHQVPASIPTAALFDAVGSATNQVMAIFEMGPWATAVEFAILNRLCNKVGWNGQQSGGVLTHGGSLANLTALLTARNVVFPDSWEAGVPDSAVLVAHADAHYCVTRSAGILGLGTRQVVSVELDDRRRMDPAALDSRLTALHREGRRVMAVSACACATPTGAFDPLDAVADVCQRHKVWLHVDAAHGGAALMSRRHRALLTGIDRADSIVWDAHKMLFVPALCTAVLYRDKSHRFQTFQQNAPYLFDPSAPGMAAFDSGMATVECTKRATGFGLWGIWSLLGEEIFERLVDRVFELGLVLHAMLTEADDFEPLHTPECNIVAFRYLPRSMVSADSATVDSYQRQLRADLIRSGRFYIVQTQLNGKAALRACVMNPTTTAADLSELLDAIREQGRRIAG